MLSKSPGHDAARTRRLLSAPLTIAMSVRSASGKDRRGGDVFEALTRKDGMLSILIADLSSKGELAERHSETLRAAFIRSVEERRRPARILSILNQLRLDPPPPEAEVAFASAFVATFDTGASSMIYASAGHGDLAMVIGQSSHRHLTSTGPLIGVLAEPFFAEREEPLEVNDLVVLVTDGVTESRHRQATELQFGTSGIVRAMASLTHDARAAHDSIARGLDDFAGGYYRDDATIAVLGHTIDASTGVLESMIK